MASFQIEILCTNIQTGERTVYGRWIQVGDGPAPNLPSVVEAMHDDIIDTEELMEQFCQHR